jgi:Ppx/GppA phosphatase family
MGLRFSTKRLVSFAAVMSMFACKKTDAESDLQGLAGASQSSSCKTEYRGALDIGSNSTKTQIAMVEVCNESGKKLSKVTKTCFRTNDAVAYSASLKSSENFPDTIISTGIKVTSGMMSETMRKAKLACPGLPKTITWRGVMTEAFRKAKNGDAARVALSKGIGGAKLKIITQQEEAAFGYAPFLNFKNTPPESIAIWDMGGGSTQITLFETLGKQHKAKTIKTALGTVTLRTRLEELKKKSANSTGAAGSVDSSFFPVGNTAVSSALGIVSKETKLGIPPIGGKAVEPQSILKGKIIFGIGGVLSKAIPDLVRSIARPGARAASIDEVGKLISNSTLRLQLPKIQSTEVAQSLRELKTYTLEQLKEFAGNNEMNVSFADTLPLSLLLYNAYADKSVLNVAQFTPVSIDGTDGLLILDQFASDSYWND